MTHEPPQVPGGSDHVELDQLADLDEDLLPPADAERTETHLAGCAQCRQRRADIRTTRALLSTLPPEPMPSSVASRIDAALAGLPSTTIVPLAAKRRSWRAHPTMAGLGAAATVAALVAALIVARTSSHHSNSSGDAGTTAAGLPSQAPLALPPATVTGTKYTARNLHDTVPALVQPGPGKVGAAGTNPSPGAAAGGATARTIAVPPSLAKLYTSTTALEACVRSVEAGGAPVKPLAVDFATYQGSPTVLVVLPGLTEGNIDAWFMGPDCGSGEEIPLGYVAVPTSSPAPSPTG